MDQEGGELGLFQISKTNSSNLNLCNASKAQFTNRLTKQTTQATKIQQEKKLSKVELSYDL